QLARFGQVGVAPLVFAALTTQGDLDGGTPIDVSAADRLFDLAPVWLSQPAPLHHELEPGKREALGGQRRRAIGALSLANRLEVQPRHEPVGRDLEHGVGDLSVRVGLVRHIRGNRKNPTVLRTPTLPSPRGGGVNYRASPTGGEGASVVTGRSISNVDPSPRWLSTWTCP